MLRHIKAHLDIIEGYGVIIKHTWYPAQPLHNPCIYNRVIFRILAYLEPEGSSKACRTCKMILHIQIPGTVGYLGIFRDIDPYSATLTGAQPCPFLKIKKRS